MNKMLCGVVAVLAACNGFQGDEEDSGAAPPPTGDGIALARAQLASGVHLVLVAADDGMAIDGADLGALEGPILGRVAARGIAGLLEDAVDAPGVHVAYDALLPPADPPGSVEIGENYPDPASTAGTPYLIPNQARPVPATGSVESAGAELLDYQTELCVVLGQEVATPAAIAGASRGFFLCEHLIDRGLSLREADRDHPELAAGSTKAGRKRGYWRTGPYLYYPADPDTYLKEARLRTVVEGVTRQDEAASAMIWSVDEIAKQALAAGTQARWTVDGLPVSVLAGPTLPAGFVMLTGTPRGTVFAPPSDDYVDRARLQYLRDAVFLTGTSFDDYVKDRYVADQRATGRYLRGGDHLEASATYLGQLRVDIQ